MSQRIEQDLDLSSHPQNAHNSGKASRKNLWDLVSNPFSSEGLSTSPNQPETNSPKPTKNDKVEAKQVNYMDSSKFEGGTTTPTISSNVSSYRQSPIPGSYPSQPNSPVLEYPELNEDPKESDMTGSSFRNFPTFFPLTTSSTTKSSAREVSDASSSATKPEKYHARRSSAGFLKSKGSASNRRSSAHVPTRISEKPETSTTDNTQKPLVVSSLEAPARPAASLARSEASDNQEDDNAPPDQSISGFPTALGASAITGVAAITGHLAGSSKQPGAHSETSSANEFSKTIVVPGDDSGMDRSTKLPIRSSSGEEDTLLSGGDQTKQEAELGQNQPIAGLFSDSTNIEQTPHGSLTSDISLPTFTSPNAGSISAWEEVTDPRSTRDHWINTSEVISQASPTRGLDSEPGESDDLVKSISIHGPLFATSDNIHTQQQSMQDSNLPSTTHRLTTDISPIFGQSRFGEGEANSLHNDQLLNRNTGEYAKLTDDLQDSNLVGPDDAINTTAEQFSPGSVTSHQVESIGLYGTSTDNSNMASDKAVIERADEAPAEVVSDGNNLTSVSIGILGGTVLGAGMSSLFSETDRSSVEEVHKSESSQYSKLAGDLTNIDPELQQAGIRENTAQLSSSGGSTNLETTDGGYSEKEDTSIVGDAISRRVRGANLVNTRGTVTEMINESATVSLNPLELHDIIHPTAESQERGVISTTVEHIKNSIGGTSDNNEASERSGIIKGIAGVLGSAALAVGAGSLLNTSERNSAEELPEKVATISLHSNDIDRILHKPGPQQGNIVTNTAEWIKSATGFSNTDEVNEGGSYRKGIIGILGGASVVTGVGSLFSRDESSIDIMAKNAATIGLHPNEIHKILHPSVVHQPGDIIGRATEWLKSSTSKITSVGEENDGHLFSETIAGILGGASLGIGVGSLLNKSGNSITDMAKNVATIGLHPDEIHSILHPSSVPQQGNLINRATEWLKSGTKKPPTSSEENSGHHFGEGIARILGGTALGGGISSLFEGKSSNQRMAEEISTVSLHSDEVTDILNSSSIYQQSATKWTGSSVTKSEGSYLSKEGAGILSGEVLGVGTSSNTGHSRDTYETITDSSELNSSQATSTYLNSDISGALGATGEAQQVGTKSSATGWMNNSTSQQADVKAECEEGHFNKGVAGVLGGTALGAIIGSQLDQSSRGSGYDNTAENTGVTGQYLAGRAQANQSSGDIQQYNVESNRTDWTENSLPGAGIGSHLSESREILNNDAIESATSAGLSSDEVTDILQSSEDAHLVTGGTQLGGMGSSTTGWTQSDTYGQANTTEGYERGHFSPGVAGVLGGSALGAATGSQLGQSSRGSGYDNTADNAEVAGEYSAVGAPANQDSGDIQQHNVESSRTTWTQNSTSGAAATEEETEGHHFSKGVAGVMGAAVLGAGVSGLLHRRKEDTDDRRTESSSADNQYDNHDADISQLSSKPEQSGTSLGTGAGLGSHLSETRDSFNDDAIESATSAGLSSDEVTNVLQSSEDALPAIGDGRLEGMGSSTTGWTRSDTYGQADTTEGYEGGHFSPGVAGVLGGSALGAATGSQLGQSSRGSGDDIAADDTEATGQYFAVGTQANQNSGNTQQYNVESSRTGWTQNSTSGTPGTEEQTEGHHFSKGVAGVMGAAVLGAGVSGLLHRRNEDTDDRRTESSSADNQYNNHEADISQLSSKSEQSGTSLGSGAGIGSHLSETRDSFNDDAIESATSAGLSSDEVTNVLQSSEDARLDSKGSTTTGWTQSDMYGQADTTEGYEGGHFSPGVAGVLGGSALGAATGSQLGQSSRGSGDDIAADDTEATGQYFAVGTQANQNSGNTQQYNVESSRTGWTQNSTSGTPGTEEQTEGHGFSKGVAGVMGAAVLGAGISGLLHRGKENTDDSPIESSSAHNQYSNHEADISQLSSKSEQSGSSLGTGAGIGSHLSETRDSFNDDAIESATSAGLSSDEVTNVLQSSEDALPAIGDGRLEGMGSSTTGWTRSDTYGQADTTEGYERGHISPGVAGVLGGSALGAATGSQLGQSSRGSGDDIAADDTEVTGQYSAVDTQANQGLGDTQQYNVESSRTGWTQNSTSGAAATEEETEGHHFSKGVAGVMGAAVLGAGVSGLLHRRKENTDDSPVESSSVDNQYDNHDADISQLSSKSEQSETALGTGAGIGIGSHLSETRDSFNDDAIESATSAGLSSDEVTNVLQSSEDALPAVGDGRLEGMGSSTTGWTRSDTYGQAGTTEGYERGHISPGVAGVLGGSALGAATVSQLGQSSRGSGDDIAADDTEATGQYFAVDTQANQGLGDTQQYNVESSRTGWTQNSTSGAAATEEETEGHHFSKGVAGVMGAAVLGAGISGLLHRRKEDTDDRRTESSSADNQYNNHEADISKFSSKSERSGTSLGTGAGLGSHLGETRDSFNDDAIESATSAGLSSDEVTNVLQSSEDARLDSKGSTTTGWTQSDMYGQADTTEGYEGGHFSPGVVGVLGGSALGTATGSQLGQSSRGSGDDIAADDTEVTGQYSAVDTQVNQGLGDTQQYNVESSRTGWTQNSTSGAAATEEETEGHHFSKGVAGVMGAAVLGAGISGLLHRRNEDTDDRRTESSSADNQYNNHDADISQLSSKSEQSGTSLGTGAGLGSHLSETRDSFNDDAIESATSAGLSSDEVTNVLQSSEDALPVTGDGRLEDMGSSTTGWTRSDTYGQADTTEGYEGGHFSPGVAGVLGGSALGAATGSQLGQSSRGSGDDIAADDTEATGQYFAVDTQANQGLGDTQQYNVESSRTGWTQNSTSGAAATEEEMEGHHFSKGVAGVMGAAVLGAGISGLLHRRKEDTDDRRTESSSVDNQYNNHEADISQLSSKSEQSGTSLGTGAGIGSHLSETRDSFNDDAIESATSAGLSSDEVTNVLQSFEDARLDSKGSTTTGWAQSDTYGQADTTEGYEGGHFSPGVVGVLGGSALGAATGSQLGQSSRGSGDDIAADDTEATGQYFAVDTQANQGLGDTQQYNVESSRTGWTQNSTSGAAATEEEAEGHHFSKGVAGVMGAAVLGAGVSGLLHRRKENTDDRRTESSSADNQYNNHEADISKFSSKSEQNGTSLGTGAGLGSHLSETRDSFNDDAIESATSAGLSSDEVTNVLQSSEDARLDSKGSTTTGWAQSDTYGQADTTEGYEGGHFSPGVVGVLGGSALGAATGSQPGQSSRGSGDDIAADDTEATGQYFAVDTQANQGLGETQQHNVENSRTGWLQNSTSTVGSKEEETEGHHLSKGVAGVVGAAVLGAGTRGLLRKRSENLDNDATNTTSTSNSGQPQRGDVKSRTFEGVAGVLSGTAIGARLSGLFGRREKNSVNEMVQEATSEPLDAEQLDAAIPSSSKQTDSNILSQAMESIRNSFNTATGNDGVNSSDQHSKETAQALGGASLGLGAGSLFKARRSSVDEMVTRVASVGLHPNSIDQVFNTSDEPVESNQLRPTETAGTRRVQPAPLPSISGRAGNKIPSVKNDNLFSEARRFSIDDMVSRTATVSLHPDQIGQATSPRQLGTEEMSSRNRIKSDDIPRILGSKRYPEAFEVSPVQTTALPSGSSLGIGDLFASSQSRMNAKLEPDNEQSPLSKTVDDINARFNRMFEYNESDSLDDPVTTSELGEDMSVGTNEASTPAMQDLNLANRSNLHDSNLLPFPVTMSPSPPTSARHHQPAERDISRLFDDIPYPQKHEGPQGGDLASANVRALFDDIEAPSNASSRIKRSIGAEELYADSHETPKPTTSDEHGVQRRFYGSSGVAISSLTSGPSEPRLSSPTNNPIVYSHPNILPNFEAHENRALVSKQSGSHNHEQKSDISDMIERTAAVGLASGLIGKAVGSSEPGENPRLSSKNDASIAGANIPSDDGLAERRANSSLHSGQINPTSQEPRSEYELVQEEIPQRTLDLGVDPQQLGDSTSNAYSGVGSEDINIVSTSKNVLDNNTPHAERLNQETIGTLETQTSSDEGFLSSTGTALASAVAAVGVGMSSLIHRNNDTTQSIYAERYPTIPSDVPISNFDEIQSDIWATEEDYLQNSAMAREHPSVRSDVLMSTDDPVEKTASTMPIPVTQPAELNRLEIDPPTSTEPNGGLLGKTSTTITAAAAAITTGVGAWLYGKHSVVETEMPRLYPTVPSNVPTGRSIIPELQNVNFSTKYPTVRSDIPTDDETNILSVESTDQTTVIATTLESNEMPLPGAYVDESKFESRENETRLDHSVEVEAGNKSTRSDPPPQFKVALGAAGAVGAVVGAGYAYHKLRKESSHEATDTEERFWILHRQKSLEDIVEHRPPPSNGPEQITPDEANFWIEHRRKSLEDILQNKPLPATSQAKKVKTPTKSTQDNIPLAMDTSLYFVPSNKSTVDNDSPRGPRQRAIYNELNANLEQTPTESKTNELPEPAIHSNNEASTPQQPITQSTTQVTPIPQLAEDYIRNTQPTASIPHRNPSAKSNEGEITVLTQQSPATTEIVSTTKGKHPELDLHESDSETHFTDPIQSQNQQVSKNGTFKKFTRTVRKRLNSLLGGRNQTGTAH
ncbi:hypothetical protein K493DRAFT_378576 [Basidiobolus meristosporus CBS 931.73]|uniref:Uncharacterized protein n=1 Tax=Basidiobolus meristosporus CBS 931.73 TaxID=1314790 RepID=A0A1Y1Y0F0_9FUNG|nr:hypothetical protein K493DRAFT_378576 [Basidiobolus meristosporus CBS 931.73]|eukprot:ORX91493.1 hypothetical protein K493DRAFT_378576 [Basidiobolus meristosporus CBS 931.73]